MQIEKMFVVSTAHLPKDVYEEMSEEYSTMSRDEGDLVHVGTSDYSEVEHLHVNLCELSLKAKQAGCEWLLFDCDADIVEGVPTFDW